MKRFFAGLLCLLTMGACSLTLSGCTLKTGVDLMQLPKPNKDRQAISDELERVHSTDAVEDAPYEGENRNTVQMVDLDGDGVEEVVAFFRAPANGNTYEAVVLSKLEDAPYEGENRNTVQMVDLDGDGVEEVVAFFRAPANGNTYEAVVLSKQSDESYTCVGRIQGTGVRIGQVSYPVVTEDGQRWSDESYTCVGRIQGTGVRIGQVSYPVVTEDGQRCILMSMDKAGDQGSHLIAANYSDSGIEVMLETDYISMLTIDLDSAGSQNVFLISGQENRRTATIYSYDEEDRDLTLMSESPLSASAKIISRVDSGYIADNQPAVFVEETVSGGSGQQTDLFVYQPEEGLRNLALSTENGTGRGTYRVVPANACDINGDGLTEIPRAVHMPARGGTAQSGAEHRERHRSGHLPRRTGQRLRHQRRRPDRDSARGAHGWFHVGRQRRGLYARLVSV